MNGLQDSQRIAFWDIVRSSTVMVSTVLLFAWNASDLALYGLSPDPSETLGKMLGEGNGDGSCVKMAVSLPLKSHSAS
jgi:hypothetical protein